MSLLKRIINKVEVKDGCWEWTGYKNKYARIKYKGYSRRAHILLYEILVQKIPKNHVLHHVCRNKSCVNPYHLNLMTKNQHTKLHAKEKNQS